MVLWLDWRHSERRIGVSTKVGIIAEGLIDDRRFAELFVRDRRRLHPMSRAALLRELRGKGQRRLTVLWTQLGRRQTAFIADRG